MKFSISLIFLLGAIPLCVTGQGVILHDAISTSVPSGTQDGVSPHTDDILLESLTFGSTVYSSTGNQISSVQSVYVVSGRSNINAEWGDDDNGSDGNPNPFVRAGLANEGEAISLALQESVDPAIQDLALASAFATRSLNEGTDGESGAVTFNVIFNSGILDNNSSIDDLPEIVIFERGNNDNGTVIRGIIGGTYDNPILSAGSVTINDSDLRGSGFQIDTTEITNGQELSLGGFDLNDFGEAAGTTFWGIQISSNGGDFYGQFFSAEDPSTQFVPEVPPELLNPDAIIVIPEPAPLLLALIFAATALGLARRRMRSASTEPRKIG